MKLALEQGRYPNVLFFFDIFTRMRIVIFILLSFSLQLANGQTKQSATDSSSSSKFCKAGQAKFEGNDFKGALTDFITAVGLNSNNWLAYRWKGDAERKQKKYEEAEQSYNSAIQINTNDIPSYKGRADARRISGKITEARGRL